MVAVIVGIVWLIPFKNFATIMHLSLEVEMRLIHPDCDEPVKDVIAR